MHKAKTPKLLISVFAVFSLIFSGLVVTTVPAAAAEDCTNMPTVQLISDPIMYSGGVYNANYIGYKITRGTQDSTSGLTVTLNSFAGPRITLATSQASTQTIGVLDSSTSTKYAFFLAQIGTASTTSETHNIVLTDGSTTCTRTTTINPATPVSPAATSNNSNKVDSVTIGTAPTAVNGTITVTVKGEPGQVGTNEGISFAPVSSASFPANKWKLQSVVIKLNQTNTWTDDSNTYTFNNRLYLPYTDASYSPAANLGAIDGKYTAIYTFELIAATGSATEMKPIQYVGAVYTGSMPAGSAPTIAAAAGSAAATAPAILPSSQTISATKDVAITQSSAFTNTGFTSSPTLSYSISPSLPSGLTIDTNTGRISGTPTVGLSTTSFTITATNTAVSGETATSAVDLTVLVPALSPSSQSISATENSAISATTAFSASNFNGNVSYAVSPSLPSGLSLNTSTGVISGTPTTSQAATSYTITGTGSTSGSATAAVSITVAAVQQQQGGGGAAAPEPSRKVTICHRTHSVTNPYVRITVDYNSVNKKSGHQIHDEIFAGEHVFKAGIYTRAKDKDWGDIIPADPTGLNRWKPLNWTALGADIYNGKVDGCPSFDPVKYFNALREAGVPEKKIKQEIAEIESEQAEAEPSSKKSNVNEIKYTGSNKNVAEQDSDKVTICHRTNSVTNPYVRITVAASSIYKNAGHYGHDEIYDGNHVFNSAVDYPNNKKDWGDIIPADPTGKNRWAALNMTPLGKKIYEGSVEGCAEKSLQTVYNELREEGKPKKEIIAELEKMKNTDVDPKDIDELTYTGSDPKTEKTEPKEPVVPATVKIPDQSLSGIVWLDINKDGLKDTDEPFMKNIKLYVVQVSSIPAPVSPANILVNATVRRADAPVKTAAVAEVLTDENGFYLFPSLGAGDWKVTTTVPDDLYVTYDSHAVSDGEITTTVPVASHAFTWVGLVGITEKITLSKITEVLKSNPQALPLSEVPLELQPLVKKAKAAIAAGKTPVFTEGELAFTGTNDLALLFFGVLLLLSGLALRLVRTKQ